MFFKDKKLQLRRLKFGNRFVRSKVRILEVFSSVFGVNRYISMQLCRVFGFSIHTKIGFLDSHFLVKIAEFLYNYVLVERGLKKFRGDLLESRRVSGCV